MLQETRCRAAADSDKDEYVAAAKAVALDYGSDAAPGIRRIGAGKGFWYRGPDGRRIEDAETLDRIRTLAIPPAWRDVWIAPTANSHLQATGRDGRGRKQYRYHERWTACRDEVKYSSLTAFARALPIIRGQVDGDLRRRGLVRERVVATVVWLLDNAMIRIGNPNYARENKSFGLTTLRDRHVAVSGSTLRFDFAGKAGKHWRLKITDRRIARVVRTVQELPGQHLFQYLDDAGERRSILSQDVNDYIRTVAADNFSSKHFRTWGGTVRAASILAVTPVPASERAAAQAMNRVIDSVAARLGNTRTICRQCYIHPKLVSAWSENRLAGEMNALRRRFRRPPHGLDREEALTLRWLEAQEAAAD